MSHGESVLFCLKQKSLVKAVCYTERFFRFTTHYNVSLDWPASSKYLDVI